VRAPFGNAKHNIDLTVCTYSTNNRLDDECCSHLEPLLEGRLDGRLEGRLDGLLDLGEPPFGEWDMLTSAPITV
jgi:hypothetical protein